MPGLSPVTLCSVPGLGWKPTVWSRPFSGGQVLGALELGVWALLARGGTRSGTGLGSSTSQRPDLWVKAMGNTGRGGACAGDGEGRSGR